MTSRYRDVGNTFNPLQNGLHKLEQQVWQAAIGNRAQQIRVPKGAVGLCGQNSRYLSPGPLFNSMQFLPNLTGLNLFRISTQKCGV